MFYGCYNDADTLAQKKLETTIGSLQQNIKILNVQIAHQDQLIDDSLSKIEEYQENRDEERIEYEKRNIEQHQATRTTYLDLQAKYSEVLNELKKIKVCINVSENLTEASEALGKTLKDHLNTEKLDRIVATLEQYGDKQRNATRIIKGSSKNPVKDLSAMMPDVNNLEPLLLKTKEEYY